MTLGLYDNINVIVTSKLSKSNGVGAVALGSLIVETRRLFHRLAAAADDAHRDLEVTASQRAVLETLKLKGPSTVPQIARDKGVSRQHIQTLVNGLLEACLLRTRPNPAHQRSSLVELTPAGERAFATIERREARILSALAAELADEDIEAATRTLAALRMSLESRVAGASPARRK